MAQAAETTTPIYTPHAEGGVTHTPLGHGSLVGRIISRVMIGCVLLYRGTLRGWLGGHCRFEPTCSQYMIDAIRRYGPWRGAWRGLRRLARCHPLGSSGWDPA